MASSSEVLLTEGAVAGAAQQGERQDLAEPLPDWQVDRSLLCAEALNLDLFLHSRIHRHQSADASRSIVLILTKLKDIIHFQHMERYRPRYRPHQTGTAHRWWTSRRWCSMAERSRHRAARFRAANSGRPRGPPCPLGPASHQDFDLLPCEFACDRVEVTYRSPPPTHTPR